MKFYLVRSPNCYRGTDKSVGKFDTLEEAVAKAVDLATQVQRDQLVYEVKLVGKAEVNRAVWREEL